MSKNDRKPPFLESELKQMIKHNEEALEKVMNEIRQLYNSDDRNFELPRIKNLMEWACSYIVQIQTNHKWLGWYNGHKTV